MGYIYLRPAAKPEELTTPPRNHIIIYEAYDTWDEVMIWDSPGVMVACAGGAMPLFADEALFKEVLAETKAANAKAREAATRAATQPAE